MLRTGSVGSRRRMAVLGLVAALAGVIASGTVAPAAAEAAVTYWYRPSHPMNHSPLPVPESDCTGGWGVRSNLNNLPYFLTAGHCFHAGDDVFGTTGRFGLTAKTHRWDPNGVDSAIVAPFQGVDGLQEIPGLGRVIGKMSNEWSTTAGNGIAMQGTHTGRTYGTIWGGWYTWHNGRRVACGSYASTGGDSGSPVFVHDAQFRVYAAGVHVGIFTGTNLHCFVTIDDLLADWGVWLPVFSAKAAASKSARPDVRLDANPPGPADTLPVRYVGEPAIG